MPHSIVEILTWMRAHSTGELSYVLLIVLLFLAPRMFLKFGLPMALTSFGLGVLANLGFEFYDGDRVIPIFSTLGIISLFLFAGLEVDLSIIQRMLKPILGHIGFRTIVLVAIALIFGNLYSLALAPAVVLALALATPSTGFILDSLETSKISESQKFWVKLKAISSELVALGVLLIFSQMNSFASLIGSFLIIGLLIVVLPYLLKKLATSFELIAPGSEFGFILMLAIISGIITKNLGAYYLVGAFLVGIVAGQYKRQSPSASVDQMLNTLRSFSTFFMPFYFFYSGLKMPYDAFSIDSLRVALFFLIISAPLKILTIILHRRLSQSESYKDSLAIAISLAPNLVFGLVLADILKNKMNIPLDIYGGLVIYTLFITLASPMVLKYLPNKDAMNIAEMNTIPMDSMMKK